MNSISQIQVSGSLRSAARWAPLEQYALTRVNAERARHLDPTHQLAWHPKAADAARAHSLDQLVRRYFSHRSPDGQNLPDRLGDLHIAYQLAGENIGLVTGAGSPAPSLISQLHRGLMDSPKHRANLLDPNFRFIGVGIAANKERIIMTQVFLA